MYFWEVFKDLQLVHTDVENCLVVTWNGSLTFSIWETRHGDQFKELDVRTSGVRILSHAEAKETAVRMLNAYLEENGVKRTH